MMTTLAGHYLSGHLDGVGTEARFHSISGIALSSDDRYLYLTEQNNHDIRRVDTQTAEVITLAGSGDNNSGFVDGVGRDARFYIPFQPVFNKDETALYISDAYNKAILKLDLDTLKVTTVVRGIPNTCYGLAYHHNSTSDKEFLYYGTYNGSIYRYDIAAQTTTALAGSTSGFLDGVGNTARIGFPTGMAISKDGVSLYFCDYTNHAVRKLDTTTGEVKTLSGAGPQSGGYANGEGYSNGTSTAKFLNPYTLALSPNEETLYVTDYKNNRIRSVNTGTGYTSKTCGGGRAGYQDGPDGESALYFNGSIMGVVLSPDGKTLYYTDQLDIGKIDIKSRTFTRLSDSCEIGSAITTSTELGATNFAISHGLAISSNGETLYLADTSSHTIRSIDIATGASTTLAGIAGNAGFTDGIGTAARFNQPSFIVVSPEGDALYITDSKNNRVRKLDITTRAVTTIAGGAAGFADGVGSEAKFNLPCGLCISSDGKNLYIADTYNHRIRKIDLETLNVTTFAGAGTAGGADGALLEGTFNNPKSIALTPDNSVMFVCDHIGGSVRKINMTTSKITTFAGTTGIFSYYEGTGPEIAFRYPLDITISPDNTTLYVTDKFNYSLRKIIGTDSSDFLKI